MHDEKGTVSNSGVQGDKCFSSVAAGLALKVLKASSDQLAT
jgi:hypothetical protein